MTPRVSISLNFVPYAPDLPHCSPGFLKQQQKNMYHLSQKLGRNSDVRFSSGSPLEQHSGCWLELWSSEGLTRPGGAASQVAHSHSWQVGNGFWQEVSVCFLWASHRSLECPYNLVADIPQTTWDTRKKGGSHNVFYHLSSESTHLHFHHILLATQTNPDTV